MEANLYFTLVDEGGGHRYERVEVFAATNGWCSGQRWNGWNLRLRLWPLTGQAPPSEVQHGAGAPAKAQHHSEVSGLGG